MDPQLVIQKLLIALGLGLLVGLQRERVGSTLAGIRTFALITLFGAVCALLSESFGGWVVACGLIATAVMLAVGNLLKLVAQGEVDSGLTTEMAVLSMYGVGAYAVVGDVTTSIVAGAIVAVLLQHKASLHGFVARIGEDDLKAIMQFVLLALVILPVLPDQTYGPFDVLNPREIWLMVVLIVGINLGGYVAYKLFGQKAGIVLSGLIGGLISSTATTVSYARRSRSSPENAALVALVILIASAVSNLRILVEIAVVAPKNLMSLGLPLSVMPAVTTVLCGAMWFIGRGESGELSKQENPAQLKSAVVFGGLYALVIFVTAVVREHFGDSGLYGVAIVSGLTDMDAITLSTAKFVETERIAADVGWRVILLASLSNLVFKAGVVAFLGHRRLLSWVVALYGVVMIAGVLLFFIGPEGHDREPSRSTGELPAVQERE